MGETRAVPPLSASVRGPGAPEPARKRHSRENKFASPGPRRGESAVGRLRRQSPPSPPGCGVPSPTRGTYPKSQRRKRRRSRRPPRPRPSAPPPPAGELPFLLRGPWFIATENSGATGNTRALMYHVGLAASNTYTLSHFGSD